MQSTKGNSPTLKLPVELLTRIFMFLLADLFYRDDHNVLDVPELPPRSVTQVCRRWRKITLNHPMFWSKLILGGTSQEEWLGEVLRRAGPMLVDLKVYMDPYHPPLDDKSPYNIKHALKRATHFRTLELHGFSSDLDIAFCLSQSALVHHKASSDFQAPFLESLTVAAYNDVEYMPDAEGLEGNVAISIEAPNLRRLALQRYSIPIPLSGPFRHIRELDISDIGPCPFFTLPELLDLVSKLTLLEEFTCKGQLALSYAVFEPYDIELPFLRRVNVGLVLDDTALMLECLKPHPTCSFTFECGVDIVDYDAATERFGTTLGDKLRQWPEDMIKDHAMVLEICPCSNTIRLDVSSPASGCRLNLAFFCYHCHIPQPWQLSEFDLLDVSSVIRDITTALAPVSKAFISIHSPAASPSSCIIKHSDLTTVISGLRHVRELTIDHLHPYLWSSIWEAPGSTPDPAPFPCLKKLTIADAGRVGAPFSAEDMTKMITSIQNRAAGSPFQFLDIVNLAPSEVPSFYSALNDILPDIQRLGVSVHRTWGNGAVRDSLNGPLDIQDVQYYVRSI